jgi:hypothetical protein
MPWVLDGNNLASGRDRERVRRAALALARSERVRIVVVFDGAPPEGSPDRESLGQVDVRYAPNADRAIIELLRASGRGWRLATGDRRLAAQARELGAEVSRASAFWERAGKAETETGARNVKPAEVADELAYFHDAGQRLPESPRRVPRRAHPSRANKR